MFLYVFIFLFLNKQIDVFFFFQTPFWERGMFFFSKTILFLRISGNKSSSTILLMVLEASGTVLLRSSYPKNCIGKTMAPWSLGRQNQGF